MQKWDLDDNAVRGLATDGVIVSKDSRFAGSAPTRSPVLTGQAEHGWRADQLGGRHGGPVHVSVSSSGSSSIAPAESRGKNTDVLSIKSFLSSDSRVT